MKRLYAFTFGIGAACVGAAGVMLSLVIDVTPSLGPAYTLLAFVIVITGGLGSMPGALLGGVLIGLTEALAGLFYHAVGQEHVRLRHPRAGAAVPPAGHSREEAQMIATLLADVPRRGLVLLLAPACGPGGRAAPRQRLPADGPHPHPLLRLCGPGLEHHDGLCRPALARSRALRRPRRLHGGGAVLPFRREPVGQPAAGAGDLRPRRRGHRVPRVPLRRGRRLLRHPHHRLRRVRPHRLRPLVAGSAAPPGCSCRSPTTRRTTCGPCAAARACSTT